MPVDESAALRRPFGRFPRRLRRAPQRKAPAILETHGYNSARVGAVAGSVSPLYALTSTQEGQPT